MAKSIDFYHLTRSPLEKALPKLLEKALEKGLRAVVLTDISERVKYLDDALWTYHPNAFLPHGTSSLGRPEEQPIWITDKLENPNKASLLFSVDDTMPENLEDFERCLDLFNGNNQTSVERARARWKDYVSKGFSLNYWQQTEEGRWEKKATTVTE